MEEYIMTIDEGTTSARAVLFNKDCEIIAICAKEFAQYYPQPGWVEQDPKEIWLTTKEVINRVVLQAGIDPRQIKAAGITNQRETVVVYDKNTGEPVYNAIGWADRRTAPYCDELKAAGKEQMFIDKTGLLIDGYFSGTEIKWILDNVPGAREKAEAGDLYFSNIDGWIMYKLTEGKCHLTDYSNKNAIKLIVTDIDGTLGPVSTDRINEEYYEVIAKLQDRGIIFGAASGRPCDALERLFAPIKDRMFFLSDNGARGVYQGRELYADAMTLADCFALVEDTRKLEGCQCVWQTSGKTYFEKDDEEIYKIMTESMHYSGELVNNLMEVTIPALKYTVYHPEDAEKATEGEFSEKWKVDHQLVCAGHNFMDVMNLEANKGNGLAKIQEYLNITKEETMAFGDNINDLEMLGNAAYSYAVGDAREEVRQAARFTAPPMTQDGVLQILKTLL